MCVYVSMYAYAGVCVCVCVCVRVCIRMCVYVCVYKCMHAVGRGEGGITRKDTVMVNG